MKIFCVISHTHWDREWYRPFEVFRLRLVNLIDRLLDILSEYPEYIFHLDAQTVVIEDYLEIKPHRRSLLKKYIEGGNIVVGPWYLQNDYMLTSGESTVRNLLMGTSIADEYGHCMKVGYSPDQFGNISQLPQILSQFNIDNFVFGRGFSKFVQDKDGNIKPAVMPAEFNWIGADGTACLAVHMKGWYNNAQRFSEDGKRCRAMIESNIKTFENCNVTPYILMMNGVDHLEAQPDLLPILDKLKKEQGYNISQYHFEQYVHDVKNYIDSNKLKLTCHSGELCMGGDYQLLRGCWSSRSYLKVMNVEAQIALEKRLEPAYSFLENSGFTGCYPIDELRYAWKQTMRNQPHDSICGCSRDEVHSHMEDLYARTRELTDELQSRAMELMSSHHDSPHRDNKNYIITVFNPTQSRVNSVERVRLEFLASENVKAFSILDHDNRAAEFEIVRSYSDLKDVFSPVNLPGTFDVDVFLIDIYVQDIPPVSARHYTVIPHESAPTMVKPDRADAVENEYFRAEVRDGGVNILIKSTNRLIENVVEWEECGDGGDSYVFQNTSEPTLYADKSKAKSDVVRESGMRATITVSNELEVPEKYNFTEACRSEKTVKCAVCYSITLTKGCPYVKIDYNVDNCACDHRLRISVATGLKADAILTDSAFDTKYHTRDEVSPDSDFFGFCNSNFAAIESQCEGVAVFSHGLHEVENVNGRLLFTVVRATGAITRMGLKVNGGANWHVPGNQEIRSLSGGIAFYPYSGDAIGGAVKNMCNVFSAGLMVNATSMDTKKYSGGRPAVQDSNIAEIFYLHDKYSENVVKSDSPLYEITSSVIEVTAVKMAEVGEGFIVRLFNPSYLNEACKFSMGGEIYSAKMSERVGKRLGTNEVLLSVKPKEIVTLFNKN